MRYLLALLMILTSPAQAADRFITLASTTSTQNSGLYDAILPLFTEKTGIAVRVIAVGTGQALRIARNGDADALIVHHRPSEDNFIVKGYGTGRQDLMYNDFVIVGPEEDPAGVANQPDAASALRALADNRSTFASRGDDSGTHLKELSLWAKAGLSPEGDWYLETGAGMGATLNLASAKDAYTLTDRGTWLTFNNKGNLHLLFSGDPLLFNPYGIILVSPRRHPHVKFSEATHFARWITSAEGQAAIAAFRIDGFQVFCPNANTLSVAASDRTSCPAEKPY